MAKQRLDATWLQCRQTAVCKVFATAEGERNRNRGRQTTWIGTMPFILSLSLFSSNRKSFKMTCWALLTMHTAVCANCRLCDASPQQQIYGCPPPFSSDRSRLLQQSAAAVLRCHTLTVKTPATPRASLSLFLNLRHNPLLFLFYPNPLPVCPLSVAIATRL